MRNLSGDQSVFVYGSLMDPELRRRLIGRKALAQPACLRDFQRRRGRYFYVVPKPGAAVEGQILEALSAEEFSALDRYEDTPRLYTRERLTVHASDGRPRSAWVYLPTRLLLESPVT